MNNPRQYVDTPVGLIEWASLQTPKTNTFGATNYEMNLTLSKQKADEFNSFFNAEFESWKEKAALENGKDYLKLVNIVYPAQPKVTKEADGTLKTSTSEYVVKLKCVASYTNKKGESVDNKPKVVDATGKDITVDVGNGSTGKARCERRPLFEKLDKGKINVMIPLRLKAVKVETLIPYAAKQDPMADF